MKADAVALRYIEELRDLWCLERRSGTLLPRMARACQSPAVGRVLRRLGWATVEHRRRLEKILEEVDAVPSALEPSSGAGVFARAELELRAEAPGESRDLVLIGVAQRLAHLRQAGYGIARTMAEKLGFSHHAAELQACLEEDAEMDFRLTRLTLFNLPVERMDASRPPVLPRELEGPAPPGPAPTQN